MLTVRFKISKHMWDAEFKERGDRHQNFPIMVVSQYIIEWYPNSSTTVAIELANRVEGELSPSSSVEASIAHGGRYR